MFSTQKEYTVKILSGSPKVCRVRFPTDEEWCNRARKQRTIRRSIGRGQTITETPDAQKATCELFEKIRIDADGQEFDSVDSCRVIEKLERCDVLSVDRCGDTYQVKLSVPGGEVSHVVRLPLQKDVLDYGRSSVRRQDGRRESISTVSLEPGRAFYDRIFVSAEGYEGEAPASIPIIHKDTVLVEVITAMDSEESEDDELG